MKPQLLIEEVKNYWDAQPCNIKHSLKPVGSKLYWQEVESRKYFVEPHIERFAQFYRWYDKQVLEIGCGIGTDAIRFVRNGANYWGTEVSKESLHLTMSRFDLFKLPAVLMLGNLEEGPLAARFDLIYSFGVIHHTPNPELLIENIEKMMKKDAEFRLMLYSKYSWKNLLIHLKLARPEAQANCPIARTFSFREIRKLLERFEIIEMRKAHIFKYQLNSYKQHKYKVQLIFKWMPDKLFNWLETKLGWHTLIVCKLKNG